MENVLFVHILFLIDNIIVLHIYSYLKRKNGKWQLTFPKLPFPIALRIWKWSKFTMRKQSKINNITKVYLYEIKHTREEKKNS